MLKTQPPFYYDPDTVTIWTATEIYSGMSSREIENKKRERLSGGMKNTRKYGNALRKQKYGGK